MNGSWDGRAALVVNGASRRGALAFSHAQRACEVAGLPLLRSVLVNPADLIADVLAAVQVGARLIVVGGGDGTVGAVAGVLAELPREERPVLGVLPLGTANDFARTLSLPVQLAAAVSVLATGKIVDIDVGRANGRVFLNVASLGLSVSATLALRPGMKRRLGPGAYPLAAMLAYRRHVPFQAQLEFPDEDLEPLQFGDLLQVAIGNGRHYGGGRTVAPDAGIDDSTLDLYAIRAGRLRDHLSVARLLRDGSLIHHEHVHHLVARAVTLSTSSPQPVNLDGEIVTTTPVEFRVQPNAIEVVVPADVTHLHHDSGTGRRGRTRVPRLEPRSVLRNR